MSQVPDLRKWHFFAVLVEEMSFTRAAQRLYISQPALSQHIRVLEREFGVGLLDRDGPRFRLTDAGRVAAEEAGRVLDLAYRAQMRVRAAGRGESGLLRLAYTRSAPGPRASGLVSAFRRRYPEVAIESETGFTSRNIAQLEAGEIDVAFVRPPVEGRSLLVVEIIDEEEVLIALPSGHALAMCDHLDRRQIAEEPVVFWSREHGSGWYDHIQEQVWPERPPKVVWEEPDDEQLMHAVAAGAGIAAVPEHRARVLHVEGVTLRHLNDPVPRTGLALAYRRGERNPLVENFLTLARIEAPGGAPAGQ